MQESNLNYFLKIWFAASNGETIDKHPNLEGESEFNSLIYTEFTIYVLSFGNLKPSSLLKVLILSRILLT